MEYESATKPDRVNSVDSEADRFSQQIRTLPMYMGTKNRLLKAQENRDFYNKSMPPAAKQPPRPQSAMAQLFSEKKTPVSKQDSFTAKVQPMLSPNALSAIPSSPTTTTAHYYPLNTKEQTVQQVSAKSSSSSSINLFAYKQPTTVTLTTTAAVNDNLLFSPQPRPPPPYPSSIHANTMQPASPNKEANDTLASERSFTVDIEALRRKFAHAPRPLKKRTSFSEPERPQIPIIPKLYNQFYKKANTPFYRPPPVEREHRSTPPPAYVDPDKSSPLSVDDKTNFVSYERNVTPAEYLKQRNVAGVRFKTQQPSLPMSPPSVDQDQLKSHDIDVVQSPQPSSPVSPLPPMPPLYATPSKGILK